jgi:predicted DNA-binding protein (UPF0251 family)
MSPRKPRIAIAAGAAAAVAVAGAGAAVGADVLSRDEQSKAVIDDAAKQLGVDPTALSDALKDALKNRIDEAVEAGKLTEEQGDALKKRIDSSEVPFLFGGFGRRGFGGHMGGGLMFFGRMHRLDAAASYLGLTDEELQAQLQDGKSLAEVAKAQGKSVDGLVQALVADAKKRLADAVADGKLTQAQADEIETRLEEQVTELVNRQPGTFRGFRGRDMWPGPGRDGAPEHWSPRA